MFSSKWAWLSFVCYVFVYHKISICNADGNLYGNDVYGNNYGSYKPNHYGGLNHSCGAYKIYQITKPLSVGTQIFYDETSNYLYFTDGPAATVYKYCIDSGKYCSVKLSNSGAVNFVIPIQDSDTPDHYLISNQDQLAILKWKPENGKAYYRNIGRPDKSHSWPQSFILDAAVGPYNNALLLNSDPRRTINGRSVPVPEGESSLIGIVDGKLKTVKSGQNWGKGIAWSLDGKVLYFGDALKKIIYCASYDEEKNSIDNVKVLVKYKDLGLYEGEPSALLVDDQNYLWIGCYGAGQIVKFDPRTEEVVCSIELPATYIITLAHGPCPKSKSAKRDCLYVTTESRSGSPHNRSVYDGSVLVITGTDSTSPLRNKVSLKTVFGKDSQGSY